MVYDKYPHGSHRVLKPVARNIWLEEFEMVFRQDFFLSDLEVAELVPRSANLVPIASVRIFKIYLVDPAQYI
jgi:hypothetical protein